MTIVACLDACVLVPSSLRNLLLECGEMHVFTPIWSTGIEDELVRTLKRIRNNKGRESDETRTYISGLLKAMNVTFPVGQIELLEPKSITDPANLPDPGDAHVIEAAHLGRASVIVTFNIRDFPSSVLPGGIIAKHPDNFLLELTMDTEKSQYVLDAVTSISNRSGQKGPPLTELQILHQLDRLGLYRFTSWASRHFEAR